MQVKRLFAEEVKNCPAERGSIERSRRSLAGIQRYLSSSPTP
jgi:hypothetical protein